MKTLEYAPVAHDHAAFLERASKRAGFREAYEALDAPYAIVRELLAARARAGMTQDAVAARMGTTKSAISRLEAGGRHAPSLATLARYAEAVGCTLEVRLVSPPAAADSAAHPA
ncbi:helix-turn-helix transcriptional regulator [Nevskia sp.]|uniref:helix-turn-helix transcriptional regulator n=1 Tax=Nevskia sp. TaxID=1929292 RepID=UPI0025F7AAD5|nr:helix-turn-helix transcriptional regulator [Nevskia sp.]